MITSVQLMLVSLLACADVVPRDLARPRQAAADICTSSASTYLPSPRWHSRCRSSGSCVRSSIAQRDNRARKGMERITRMFQRRLTCAAWTLATALFLYGIVVVVVI